MGIWQRIKNATGFESRATLKEPEFFRGSWAGTPASSGEAVNETTARGWSAWFACIRNISEDVAKLPLGVFEPTDTGGRIEARNTPLWRLLHDSPNPEMTSFSFRETLTAHALSSRGGFAEIIRDGSGTVQELWPLDPNTVDIDIDQGGRTTYRVGGTPLAADRMLHIHGLGYEGVTSYRLALLAKESLGRSLAAQKHNGAVFGNGAMTSGVLEVPKVLSPEAFAHLRESWTARYGGGGNSGKPAILEMGTTFKPTALDAEKSQLIASLDAGVVDTARWFRMPPHKIQHLANATFSNIEQQNIQYVVDCLSPWLARWEQEIARKLFVGKSRGLYAKHNVNGLLRGDSKTRGEFYSELFGLGVLTTNDIRRLEDMDPVGDDGDARYVPSNLMLLGSQGPTVGTDTASDDGERADTPAVDGAVVERMAAAYEPIVARVFAGLLRVERDKANRADRKGKLGEWADGFYPDHAAHVRSELGEVVDPFVANVFAAVGAVGDADLNRELVEYVKDAAGRHVTASRSTLDDRDGFWQEKRAATDARDEMRRLAAWTINTLELTDEN